MKRPIATCVHGGPAKLASTEAGKAGERQGRQSSATGPADALRCEGEQRGCDRALLGARDRARLVGVEAELVAGHDSFSRRELSTTFVSYFCTAPSF